MYQLENFKVFVEGRYTYDVHESYLIFNTPSPNLRSSEK